MMSFADVYVATCVAKQVTTRNKSRRHKSATHSAFMINLDATSSNCPALHCPSCNRVFRDSVNNLH